MTPRPFLLAFLVFGLVAMPAAALKPSAAGTCRTMAGELAHAQEKIVGLKADRDALAQDAETAGAAWEDSEVHRLISDRHAARANTDQAAFEAAKSALAEAEAQLQANVSSYNQSAADYNARCAPKKR